MFVNKTILEEEKNEKNFRFEMAPTATLTECIEVLTNFRSLCLNTLAKALEQDDKKLPPEEKKEDVNDEQCIAEG